MLWTWWQLKDECCLVIGSGLGHCVDKELATRKGISYKSIWHEKIQFSLLFPRHLFHLVVGLYTHIPSCFHPLLFDLSHREDLGFHTPLHQRHLKLLKLSMHFYPFLSFLPLSLSLSLFLAYRCCLNGHLQFTFNFLVSQPFMLKQIPWRAWTNSIVPNSVSSSCFSSSSQKYAHTHTRARVDRISLQTQQRICTLNHIGGIPPNIKKALISVLVLYIYPVILRLL